VQVTTQNIHVPKLRFKEFDGDWIKKKLSDFSDKISDGIHSTPNYSDEGGYYFVNGNNFIDGKIVIHDNTKRVDENEYARHKRPLRNNTILLSINGTIGNIAYYNNEPIVLGKSACYINLNKKIETKIVYQLIQSDVIKKYFNSQLTGSTIMNLSLKSIKTTPITLPTLPEQEKIASFLSAVDERIQKLERKKSLLEDYKKGVMRQLFSQEIRFKNDNGNNYPDWEEKKLGELCDIIVGGTPSTNKKEYWNGSIGWLSSGALNNSNVTKPSKLITKLGLENSSAKIMPANTVMLAMTGATLGRIGLLKFNCSGNQSIAGFTPNDTFVSMYLFYVLLYGINQIFKYAGGAAQQGINKQSINNLRYLFPIKKEQKKIASFLSGLDKKIELVETQIQQSKNFKKGLLQQMFV